LQKEKNFFLIFLIFAIDSNSFLILKTSK
jgi:hypothetical protein